MTGFKTDISKQGKQFELVFTTDNKEHFNKVQSVARDCIDHKPITQFDRIKAMSVEELAEQLIEYRDDWGDFATNIGYFEKYEVALAKEIEWLESEVQGE